MAAESLTISLPYKFTETQDWFSSHIENWTTLLPLVTSPNPRILEIGSWEGRSAVFLAMELCKRSGEIVCIDHFDMMRTDAGRERYDKLMNNLSLTGTQFRILQSFSVPGLMQLLDEEMSRASPGFDWIYIDGSHRADDTMLDAELSWRLARQSAIVIFDDYLWPTEPPESIEHPKRGIDAFMNLHAGEFKRLSKPDAYQMVIQKTGDMRIGFLSSSVAATEHEKDSLQTDFNYSVNLAMVIDSGYAMAAGVAIRSAVTHTPGRISIYVVDCGLTPVDREKIQASLPAESRITIVFIELPPTALALKQGAPWAKIDLIAVVPVERVLYLDADVLIRKSLRDLWDMDLDGATLAAARDVGYPLGHGDMDKAPYYNTGVLLIDLAKARTSFPELVSLAEKMRETRFNDQDVLNVHFSGAFKELHLKWNAQGLGTYANMFSVDRNAINLREMNDPCIVHFTGPVHPTMSEVLHEYVQPYTAKPWGYAGAPGHPYATEWFAVVKHTTWKAYWDSEELQEVQAQKIEEVIRQESQKFRQKLLGIK